MRGVVSSCVCMLGFIGVRIQSDYGVTVSTGSLSKDCTIPCTVSNYDPQVSDIPGFVVTI